MTIVVANERGIALVITLLIVALLTITVVEFTYSVQIDQHMARNALSSLQASLLARSGINLGEAFLLHDDDPTVDAFTEEWCPAPGTDGYSCDISEANSQMVIPENMRLRVQILDEGGKLNINVLSFRNAAERNQWLKNREGTAAQGPPRIEAWSAALQRLLENRGVSPDLADQLLEYWDNLYEVTSPTASQTPPASNTAELQQYEFASLDDVSVVSGWTPSVIRRLRPVVTALPRRQDRVNANTAPAEVLQAIVDDDEALSNIISQRSDVPLKLPDLLSLTASLNHPGTIPPRNMLGVTSYYFLVRASAIINPNPTTGRGGIRRSASMLVNRTRRTARSRRSGSDVPWTLTQLDWQREGGAVLFQEPSDGQTDGDDLRAPGAPG